MDSQPPNDDDDYEQKLKEMQKYIPILENLIDFYKDKPQSKIFKLQNLYQTLKASTTGTQSRKLKKETLDRCDDVLKKLVNKCEKSNKLQSRAPASSCSSEAQPGTSRGLKNLSVPTVVNVEENEVEPARAVVLDDEVQVIDPRRNNVSAQVSPTRSRTSRNDDECWEIPQNEPLQIDETETNKYDEEEGEIVENDTPTNSRSTSLDRTVTTSRNDSVEKDKAHDKRERTDKTDRHRRGRSRERSWDRSQDRSRDKSRGRSRDRSDKRERYERPDKHRYDRYDRSERYDRFERHDRYERFDKYDKRDKERKSDAVDVTSAAKSMADKIGQKPKRVTALSHTEGFRRSLDDAGTREPESSNSSPQPLLSPTPAPAQNLLKTEIRDKDPRVNKPTSFIDILNKPPLSDDDLKKLLVDANESTNKDTDEVVSVKCLPKFGQESKVTEEVKKLDTPSARESNNLNASESQSKPDQPKNKNLSNLNSIQTIVSPNSYDRYASFQREPVDKPCYQPTVNPNIIVIGAKPTTPEPPRISHHNFRCGQVPNVSPVHPGVNNVPLNPEYGSPSGGMQRAPPEYQNQSGFHGGFMNPGPYPMGPNVVKDSWTRGPGPDNSMPQPRPLMSPPLQQQMPPMQQQMPPMQQQMPPMQQQMQQPMPPMQQQMQQMAPPEMNRPFNMPIQQPRMMQPNPPYQQFNYHLNDGPRPHWETNNCMMRPDEGRMMRPDESRMMRPDEGRMMRPDDGRMMRPDEGRMMRPEPNNMNYNADMRPRPEMGPRPGPEPISHRPMQRPGTPSFTRANMTYGQVKANRFSWDNRNGPERSSETRPPDRAAPFSPRAPEKDPRSISDRDPRNVSGRDPRLNRNCKPGSPDSSSPPKSQQSPAPNMNQKPQKEAVKVPPQEPKTKPVAPKSPKHKGEKSSKDSRDKKGSKFSFQDSRKRSEGKSSDKKSSRSSESEPRKDKTKEVYHSPLESLYGVVNTSRTGPGYGIQKFKIPKIKRKPTSPSQKEEKTGETSPQPSERQGEDNWDEVSSSEPSVQSEVKVRSKDVSEKVEGKLEGGEEKDSLEMSEILKKFKNSSIDLTPEIAQSFVSFLKKKKKTKVGHTSAGSDSSKDSEVDFAIGKKKKKKKKAMKRQVIQSDSSEDEKEETEKTSENVPEKMSENVPEKTSENVSENKNESCKTEVKTESIKDSSEPIEAKVEEPKEDCSDKPGLTETVGDEGTEQGPESENQLTELSQMLEVSKEKKPKKRRNSLEKLHDDIRDMFISNDVISATGQRSCRSKGTIENKTPEPPEETEEPKRPKSRKRTKAKPKAPLSKEIVDSSDQENEEKSEEMVKPSNQDEADAPSSDTLKVSLVRLDISKFVESNKLDNSSLDESSDSEGLNKSKEEEERNNEVKDGAKMETADVVTSETDASRASTPTINQLKEINDDASLQEMLLRIAKKKKMLAKKKKKKRLGWQNGILPKKKSKVAKESSISPKTVMENVEDKQQEEKTEVHKMAEKMEDKMAVSKIEDKMAGSKVEDKMAVEKVEAKEEMEPPAEEASAEVKDEEVKSQTIKITNKQMLDYVWVDQKKFKCLCCAFTGKNIVHHYSVQHPDQDVLISRLSMVQAKNAIGQASSLKGVELKLNANVISTFKCRFCRYVKTGAVTPAILKDFYEHCTTHTGEFRYKCSFCPYRSLNKGTVKAHFYKVCRKSSASNVSQAVLEDEVPQLSNLFGYICTKCNFVQLHKTNVEAHIKRWHSRDADVEILMIDMSDYTKPETRNVDNLHLMDDGTDVDDEKGTQSDEENFDTLCDILPEEQAPVVKDDIDLKKTVKTPEKSAPKSPAKSQKSPARLPRYRATKSQEKRKSPRISEATETVEKNLSAFVCPPELEKHEEEIQLERKKRMQEIAENIGIRTAESTRKQSIIDKLRDKMETNKQEESPSPSVQEESATEGTGEVKMELPVEVSQIKKSASSERLDLIVPEIKTEEEHFEEDKEPAEDPLGGIGELKAESESESYEQEANPVYASDSSEEIEPQLESTDVNNLLKESSVGPTHSSMMTTIQRLAASLKANKSGENLKDVEPEMEKEETTVKPEEKDESEGIGEVPKKPLIRMRGDLFGSSEADSPVNETRTDVLPTPTEDSFCNIRIESVVSLQDETASELRKKVELSPIKSTAVSLLKSPLVLKRIPIGVPIPGKAIKAINPVSKEPMKLIPITSISHSLPRAILPESQTYHLSPKNITLTVATSTRTTSMNTPTITAHTTPVTQNRPQYFPAIGSLARPTKSVLTPITVTSKGVLTPVSNRITTVPMFKVSLSEPKKKVVLKSSDTMNAMLIPEKLHHLYKCMAGQCCYSTNSVSQFQTHYKQHFMQAPVKDSTATYDFQQCAYCSTLVPELSMLLRHIEEKHSYCNFLCRYCFYRAACNSYVEVHQKNEHPGKDISVLIVEQSVPLPPQGPIDRPSRVQPYKCIDECKKFFFIPDTFQTHLNMRHSELQGMYPCSRCNERSPTPSALIEHHHKMHNISKYQCIYCDFGAMTIEEIHVHLSELHYNQHPIVLERTLPQQPLKHKSAIDQLLLRNLDNTSRETPTARTNFSPDSVRKVYQGPLSKTNDTLSQVTCKMPIIESISSLKRPEASPSTSGSDRKRFKMEYVLTKIPNLTQTPSAEPTNDKSLKEDDEFISTNLLDKSDLLKTVDPLLSTESIPESDSDIEIIEETFVGPKSKPSKDDGCITPDPHQSSENKPENEAVGNDNQNVDENEFAPKVIVQPTSIDEIKDTGLFGKDLFVCPFSTCGQRFDDLMSLKVHVKECLFGVDVASFVCPHCDRTFIKTGFYLEHLKSHGIKRFGCTMCEQRYPLQCQALQHMRNKHKVNCKVAPVNPQNPSPDGLYILVPQNFRNDKVKGKKKFGKSSQDKSPAKSSDVDKVSFGPNDINILPLQAIYSREVHCAVCTYTTKVRTNIIRHLQLHLKEESVPESAPVNPVPCLEKREKMFDKMVNLASSSHENGRMSGAKKDLAVENELNNLPKFVPENKRYVCGVPECSYLTVDEAMLRYHLKALHSDEPYFRCSHCSHLTGPEAQNIAIDKMAVHLKMHDTRLYKCSHCNYHHYHRYVVERHLSDKHPEKRPFVKVIREEASEPSTKSTSQEEVEDEQSDLDGDHWRCNLCDHKCVYKAEMVTHAATTHDEKCQFKCTGCNFKTVTQMNVDQHLVNKHPTDLEITFTMVYQKIKGAKRTSDLANENSSHDEPFDTTPLWRRDMPRIRHIRGILLEEEDEDNLLLESNQKSTKRKNEEDSNAKGSKPKLMKIDNSLEENKSKTADGTETADVDATSNPFGPYGKPIDNLFVCPLCPSFKTKYKHDMRDHLYRELKYARWSCKECGFLSINKTNLAKHSNSKHPNQKPNMEVLSPDDATENWVYNVLKTQSDLIKKAKTAEEEAAPETVASTSERPTHIEISLDSDDDEVKFETSVGVTNVPELEQRPEVYRCKHCNTEFAGARGFKRHVMLRHLKLYNFLCPHCDRSAKSQLLMLQHIRSKHPGQAENVVYNTNPKPKINDAFWQREYGIRSTPKKKKQKQSDDSERKNKTGFECKQCNYVSLNLAGYKSHAKTHDRGTLKCSYCTFTTTHQAEVTRHSEVNHPNQPVKYEIRKVQGEVEIEPEVVTVDDYNNDIEEEEEDIIKEEDEKDTVYKCIGCDLCSISQESIRIHWNKEHKTSDKNTRAEFKCRKTKLDAEESLRTFKCYYCNVKTTVTNIIIHVTQHHGNVPVNFIEPEEGSQEIWFCGWCQEVCNSRTRAKNHHRMFHSHLNPDFKRLPRRSFKCPSCNYQSENLSNLRKHFARHINLIKCKYCHRTFQEQEDCTQHIQFVHPGLKNTVEIITNFDEQANEMMMKSVQDHLGKEVWPSSGTARKSTARPAVSSPSRSVARKSTAKSANFVKPKPFSWYGKAREPTDLAKVKVQVTLSGRSIKVDCLTLSNLVNINPTILLKDCQANDTL